MQLHSFGLTKDEAGDTIMKITTILDQIDLGSMALPEFQRGYVWNRDQVRDLMQSLYRRYPVGSLLVWITRTESMSIRGDGPVAPSVVELILDGQQRITTLYGIIRGRSPKFFDGNPQAFTGLYFHLDEEIFEFYGPLKMKACVKRWEQAGFFFDLDWLLRNITTILTSQAMFSALKDIDTPSFQEGLQQAEKTCNYLLNMISGRLGLDNDRVLGGRYAFPVMTCYLAHNGGRLQDARQRDKLLYWYIQSFLSGRFTGSTETALNQDLRMLDDTSTALDRLMEQLRLSRRDLRIRPEDFAVSSLGARFYPMLYMLTRVRSARNWGDGLPLSAHLLGKLNALQVHHIFPKAILYKHGYPQADVNAIANFCFLTQGANLDISAKEPVIYFKEIEEKYPGALASQWIPMDHALWKVERYKDFLAERRKLLADAANEFLDALLTVTPVKVDYPTELTQVATTVSGEENDELQNLVSWAIASGFPKPELNFEVCDINTGEVLTIVNAAWPKGLQEGYSQPIALILDADDQKAAMLNQAGYRFFTSIEAIRRYLKEQIDNGTKQAA